MVKPARSRRERQRRVAGRQHEGQETLVDRTLGRRPERVEPTDATVTVQLLPHLLAAGALPPALVGDEIDVAPAIYLLDHLPNLGSPERWRVDPNGTMDAYGTIVASPRSPASCDCWVDVLDAGGTLFPLNWAATTPTEGPLWVHGAFYLDPEVSFGADQDDSVVLCLRRHRVRAVRRYTVLDGRPFAPVMLDGLPTPDEVDADTLFVADLVPTGADLPEVR
jgi:hypothetical protein